MSRSIVLASALCLLASPAFGGWLWTQAQTTQATGGDGDLATTQKVWLEGSSAKIEFLATDNPMIESGSYLLIQDSGKKVFLVNPKRKSYARFDARALGSGMEAMAGSGFEMTIEDPKMVKLLEEPGLDLLGHPTTHYRFHTTYTSVLSMPMGMKTTQANDVIEDLWTAPTIEVGGTAQSLSGLGGGAGTPQELFQLERKVKATVVGLPLKQVTVTETKMRSKGSGLMGLLARRPSGLGGDDRSTTTVVIKDLVEATLPASTFQIPTGFAETEIMQGGPAMPDLSEEGH